MFEWFTRREIETVKPKFYIAFEPQLDITAFELSNLLLKIPGFNTMFRNGNNKMAVCSEEDLSIWKNLPSPLRRHFRVTDKWEEEDGR